MVKQLTLGDITIDVILKDIKNVHLKIHPPTGEVRISAPARMPLDTIRLFAISKLDWIRRHRQRFVEQEREPAREYLDRESHYVWGKRHLLSVSEGQQAPKVELEHNRMILRVRPGTDTSRRHSIVESWYREQVKEAIPPLLAKWEPVVGATVERFFVRRMRTKWGSCNSKARSIRLNTDLARKPPEFLEYVVVHELVHLLEPGHGPRFVEQMDRALPQWQFRRDSLNRLPVVHDAWT
jgi:predicted metal-dependent hydrolase